MTFVRTYRFYQHDRLITELNGQMARSVFRHKNGLLAQETFADSRLHTLMAVSDTDSVMAEYGQGHVRQRAYDAYGRYLVDQDASQTPLAFNGQPLDLVPEGYLLGNGYRLFSPAVRRFYSPDSLSPFGRGGSNAYAYCAGDPLNRTDPSGHLFIPRRQLDITSGIITGAGFIINLAGLVASASGSKEAGEVMIGAGVGLMVMGAVIQPRALGRYLTGSSAPESSAGSRSLSLARAPVTIQNDPPPSYETVAANSATMNVPQAPTDIPPPSYTVAIALQNPLNSQTQNAINSRNSFELQNSFSYNNHANAIRESSNL
ncbi:RHS repeat-associated core domain-containing protein [Pseudomonas sp.]|uniref:RHS repeat-associated core domain-containing protein n=1 Tax=Pseudomonas sp. TaxID=306 RepID=UPI0028A74AD5|nr:RHS repeat-associated core domain-containing protein [Pseudomonas sp.]